MASENDWYTVACGARRYSLPVRYHQLTLIENGGFSDIMRAQDTFIHSAGITHCNITPDNIEIDDETNVTICNFDLARNASIDFDPRYWTHRGYYAPEVVTEGDTSNPKRDIWSVGCIMGELIRRKTTFQGTDILTVLQGILNLVDIPDIKTLNEICSETHPFLNEYRYPDEEPTVARMIDEHFDAHYGVSKWKLEIENYKLDRKSKALIWDIIQNFSPPIWVDDSPDAGA
ncbi:unnamed protein product [Rotaria sordida]|uniref:Protein kinase domain-containing protein n=1 Tax=Rotaria sordida TaxID=392033 RepID=A0A815I7V6_9BILA|nr:unnamed protein product [Rotaria sordida]CAF1607410.1 unnamed protein product [Rotaria sordida]